MLNLLEGVKLLNTWGIAPPPCKYTMCMTLEGSKIEIEKRHSNK